MRKTVRLYQRLYAFSKRTGSTANLQRIPSSEEREVGEPVGGRASHREAGAIGQEPTSGLEPLTCSLRVCGRWLLDVAEVCKFLIGKGFLVP
jgi:hypothetical protein